MTHALAFAVGYFAGAITLGAIALVLRRPRWNTRHRPHRYQEIL